MPKQRSVEGAFDKPGGKSGAYDMYGRFASFGLFIVIALFLMTLSGDGKAEQESSIVEMSAQARLPTNSGVHSDTFRTPNHSGGYDPTKDPVPTRIYPNGDFSGATDDDTSDDTPAGSSNFGGLRGRNGDTESEMSDLVMVTANNIKNAEMDEVAKEKGMLSSALSSVGKGIRNGLATMLGKSSDSEEVNQIAQEIENRLEKDTTDRFEESAFGIEEEEVGKIEMNVEMEESGGVDIRDIEDDVLQHEGQAITDVRQKIDQSAEDIQKNLKFQAAMFEKEIMEKRLSEQLGYQVKLQIMNDEVQGVQAALNQGRPQQGQNGYQQQPQYYYPPPQQQGYYQQQPYYPPPQQGQQQGGGVPYQLPPGQGQYAPPPQQQQQQQQQQGGGFGQPQGSGAGAGQQGAGGSGQQGAGGSGQQGAGGSGQQGAGAGQQGAGRGGY
eukprot:CAMPEP_0198138138 /NCGR_PEP_ID=MMETSP1443-20131203/1548_1 /TAXON_ID=186043 /ORGANISM="Entomoneis sp., Strain CCMP2396" /LENGTH=437 /DNA_ID=CAMNT_0043799785 /DNA_START=181 /DNA_END=1494 /DNA_ORIENTATION=-